jgi:hypothetical protein
MILIPILLPVLMGMLVAVAVVVALGAVLFGTLVSILVSGGASMVSAHRRKRAESRQEAVAELTAIPPTATVPVEGDMPEAA